MPVSYPSLGPKGIITDPNEILRVMFDHGFRSDRSQSVLFRHTVFSFQEIAANYGNDVAEHAEQLERQLTTYLGSVFTDYVRVTVVEANLEENRAKYALSINADVSVDGISYNLGFALFVDDTTVYSNLINDMP